MSIRRTPSGGMEALDADGVWKTVPLAAAEEIERCHARLEIDHYFQMDQDDNLVRFDIPLEGRLFQIDGIDCRDATIAEMQRDT